MNSEQFKEYCRKRKKPVRLVDYKGGSDKSEIAKIRWWPLPRKQGIARIA